MRSSRTAHTGTMRALEVYTVLILLAASLAAQTAFDSGSTGVNGAFPPRVPPTGTTAIAVNLNDGMVSFRTGETIGAEVTLPNVPAGGFVNGILHLTTLNLPPDITLTFVPNARNTPVIILASGDVTIAGVIDVSGATGTSDVRAGNQASGGPGGFRGGLGAAVPQTGNNLVTATPGEGPGSGAPGTASSPCGSGGGYGTVGGGPLGGQTYGDSLIRLLIGGSGGGGGFTTIGNGGGGGGALFIASSGIIRLDGGRILANGGNGRLQNLALGGGGSGGSIRLVANRLEGAGTTNALQAIGGIGDCEGVTGDGGAGRIRLEAFFINGISSLPTFSLGPPLAVGLPSPIVGSIRITEVAGQIVFQPTMRNPSIPDVVFSEAGEITIRLATSAIPVGTSLLVRVVTGEHIIDVISPPTDTSGRTTVSLIVPAGVGAIQAFATLDITP